MKHRIVFTPHNVGNDCLSTEDSLSMHSFNRAIQAIYSQINNATLFQLQWDAAHDHDDPDYMLPEHWFYSPNHPFSRWDIYVNVHKNHLYDPRLDVIPDVLAGSWNRWVAFDIWRPWIDMLTTDLRQHIHDDQSRSHTTTEDRLGD